MTSLHLRLALTSNVVDELRMHVTWIEKVFTQLEQLRWLHIDLYIKTRLGYACPDRKQALLDNQISMTSFPKLASCNVHLFGALEKPMRPRWHYCQAEAPVMAWSKESGEIEALTREPRQEKSRLDRRDKQRCRSPRRIWMAGQDRASRISSSVF